METDNIIEQIKEYSNTDGITKEELRSLVYSICDMIKERDDKIQKQDVIIDDYTKEIQRLNKIIVRRDKKIEDLEDENNITMVNEIFLFVVNRKLKNTGNVYTYKDLYKKKIFYKVFSKDELTYEDFKKGNENRDNRNKINHFDLDDTNTRTKCIKHIQNSPLYKIPYIRFCVNEIRK